MFGKNLVLDIRAKMFSTNQIAVFLKEQNLQNKFMKHLIFCMLIPIQKIKFRLIIFWLVMVKNSSGQSDYKTLKLNVFQG